MATVHIRVNGHGYEIACDDGQEEHLRFLADEIDDRIHSLVVQMGANPGEGMALLLAALTLADDALENKREIEILSGDIQRLTALVNGDRPPAQAGGRMQEIESAMAETLEEIALRIEKIAQQIEVG